MAGGWNIFRDKHGSEKQRFVVLATQASGRTHEGAGELSLLPADSCRFPLVHGRISVNIN